MDIKVYEQLPEDTKYIRRNVFIEEQGFENEFDDIDDMSTHILIYESSDPVATCRLYYNDERQNYVIGRIAVLKKFRGKNYGDELIKMAEQEIVKMQGKTVHLAAQVRVSAFYKKNGYIALDEVHIDEGCMSFKARCCRCNLYSARLIWIFCF
ncbi:GCN5-related N-acetyltransferase [Ruminiclostridium papyrosolvens DSM 2782]|uniref:GCN5-related N-acetyltransferase n=1 Tax=Ruminiclostridium papyrosolvens DSM 2782 TaxID=588581 RepID=F1T940_9FIRM|nr:GNAT family N-acetyltransferase [Ruminiclostridium papyrosolvens]EGD49022.1 GCN5-related N-acetyltransferase [Ruminiclostridium papyrosolvens DSM 2782]WES35505.1 GNAT family N-acetyltransferase [Ruminiclostridium papyrosolvens DSM 2782]